MQVLVDTSYCESLHFWAFYQNSTTRVNGWHHKLANKLSLGLRGRRNSSSLGAPRAVPERVCSGLVQHICCYFSLPSAHGYSVKLPNFTSFFLYGERKHKTTILFFVFCTWIRLSRIQLEKKFACIWQIERDGIIVMTF